MRKIIPIAIGGLLVLLGVGWTSQGAGLIGGSSLMDDNPTFIYLGAGLAAVGLALVALGATAKARAEPPIAK